MTALWIAVVVAVFASGGVLVYLAWRHDRRAGAPEPEILDVTEPLEPESGSPGALTQCPHGRPLSRGCEECDRQWRAPHVTIDDDEPKGVA